MSLNCNLFYCKNLSKQVVCDMAEVQMKLSCCSFYLSLPSCCSRLYLSCLTVNALFWVCRWALSTLSPRRTSQTEEKQLTSPFLKLKASGLWSKGSFLSSHRHRVETWKSWRWYVWKLRSHQSDPDAHSKTCLLLGCSDETGYVTILK